MVSASGSRYRGPNGKETNIKEEQVASRGSSLPIGLLILAVAALAIVVFAPGLSGGFLFDDFPALVDNPAVQLTEFSAPALWEALASFDPGGFGRPLAMLSFALNHLAAGGFEPFGFKLTGLLLHALNAVLVLVLLDRVFARLGLSAGPRVWWAGVLAALWAVHPLQVSTVLYVVQRMEVMATTFVLLSLLAYLAGRSRQISGRAGWPWLLLSAALVLPGALCKETAVLLPVFTLVLEWAVLGFAAHRPQVERALRWGYALATVIAVLGYLFLYLPRFGSLEPFASRGFDSVERILTQLRVLPLYLQQILVPVPSTMTFYYDDFSVSRGLFRPWTTFAGLLGLGALLVLAVLARRRVPLVSLGVLWFLGAHILSSNAQPLELVFEHRNYFALLGVLIAAFGLVREAHLKMSPRLLAFIAVVLVVGVGALGMLRAATWANPLLLATHQVDVNPDSGRARVDLGMIYFQMADGSPDSPFFSFAMRTFEGAADLPQGNVQAAVNLALMRLSAGQSVPDEDWRRMRRTLTENPVSPEASTAVWRLFDSRHQGVGLPAEELRPLMETLFAQRGQKAFRYAILGDYLREELERPQEAQRYYLKAAERAQGEVQMVRAVMENLLEAGDFVGAAEVGEHARRHGVDIDPPADLRDGDSTGTAE